MVIHHHQNKFPTSADEKTINNDYCACKGIRYCKICFSSERVKNLNTSFNTLERFLTYTYYYYNLNNKRAYPSEQLNYQSSLQVIEEHIKTCLNNSNSNGLNIPGLLLIENFLSPYEESILVDKIDRNPWVLSQSGRKKQDYGPRVNFKQQKIKMNSFIGLPDYADLILNKMLQYSIKNENVLLRDFLLCEVCNLEYLEKKNSSIAFHMDDTWIWGEQDTTNCRIIYVPIPRCSLLLMSSESRYHLKHGILPHHIFGRRISITLREPTDIFKEGGDLYDEYGKDLLRISNYRITT